MAQIRLQGTEDLKRMLERMTKEVTEDIKDAVEDSAITIELNAAKMAPAGINQLIDKDIHPDGLSAEIGVQGSNLLPIYIEFGTGQSAAQYVPTLPQEIQEVARQYYINGKGRIIKQPYLIPAYLAESPKFVEKIKNILEDNVGRS